MKGEVWVLLVGSGRRLALVAVDVYDTLPLMQLWHLSNDEINVLATNGSLERKWVINRRPVRQVFQLHHRRVS